MSSVTASMGMDIAEFRSAMLEVNRIVRAQRARSEADGKSGGQGFAGGFAKMVGGVALGNIIADGLRTAVATAREIGRQIGRQAIEGAQDAAEAERIVMSFEILTGSKAGGNALFQELRADALRSGRDIDGMADSMKRFLAMDMSVPDALKLNRSLMDIAGSIGMSNAEAGLLGSALAQVMAKGTASMEELRQQIAEKGVPIFDVLAQKLGVTTGELIKMVSEGKVGADVVIEAFMNLEGALGRFRGGVEKMAATSGGAWALLRAEINDTRREMMAPIVDAFTPVIIEVRNMLKSMKADAIEFGQSVAQAVTIVAAVFEALGTGGVITTIGMALSVSFKSAVNVLIAEAYGAAGLIGGFFANAGNLFANVLSIVRDPEFWAGLGSVFGGIALTFRAGLLEAGAALLDFMKDVPLFGEQASIAAGSMRLQADADKLAASPAVTGGIGQLRNDFDQMMAAFSTAIAQSMKDYQQGRENAPQMDTKYEEGFLRDSFNRIWAMVSSRLNGQTEESPGGSGGGGQGDAVVKGGGVIGGFAQAINLAQGRTVAEVMADVGSKQTDAQNKTNEKIDKTNETLGRIATTLGMAPDININVRPVWSNG